MGMMVNGRWDRAADRHTLETRQGRFERKDSAFRGRITRDGAEGFPAEAGRYHLYVAYGCPWAHRVILMRALKGLEPAVSMSVAIPNGREDGWEFGEYPGAVPDGVNGFRHLHEAYAASDPGYTGVVSVPVLWDRRTRCIVNNESSEIIRMLNAGFAGVAGNDLDFYPESLRERIDEINAPMYADLNNGVYRCGFAATQDAYEEALARVFEFLDRLEARLAGSRYLVGDRLTEADIRLFCTLVRFDAVYHALFKCCRRRIADYPSLSGYLRDLYQHPGFAPTVNLAHIVRSYYSVTRRNPGGIIPAVPPLDLDRPHDRCRLGAAGARD